MEEFARSIEASDIAGLLRRSRWSYPAVNTLHVLGIALLLGCVIPMDLRLIGAWRPDIRLATALRLLRPVAAAGACLAIPTGALLFAVQATDYAAQPLFAVKMGLVAAGLAHALAWGTKLEAAPRLRQQLAAAFSMAMWIGALVCGRMLGYL